MNSHDPTSARPLVRQLQDVGGFNEQVLVLLHAAELRSQDRAAAPSEVAELFSALRLPRPKNERQHLIQLKNKKLAMQPKAGMWAVTPRGLDEIGRLMGKINSVDIEQIGRKVGEPVFAGAAHHRIPSSLAPAMFEGGIVRFQEEHPGDRNVFMMVRYPKPSDAFGIQSAIDACHAALMEVGMVPHLASDSAKHDQLFPNVGVYLWSCDYGVAILEEREEALNYNVVLEIGAMLMTGRRCLLLKDKSVKKLPGDLIAHIHKGIDLDETETIRAAIKEWVTADLGLT